MCRPKWSFLLMYGSHNMRHTVFHRLTVVKGTPRDFGCHTTCPDFGIIYDEVSNGNCHEYIDFLVENGCLFKVIKLCIPRTSFRDLLI